MSNTTTTVMTGTWDVSALPSSASTASTASTTPSLHNRRGQQYQRSISGHTKPHSRERSTTPFPRKNTSSEDLLRDGDIDQAPAPTQRTVRRKKSSLDLRDIFLNGGVSSGPQQHSPSS